MTRISTAELERLLERARAHGEEEQSFFRCLLDAWVYTHVPLSDDHPRMRLVQFQHPDGFLAVPFFTSEAKAQFAARGAVRIVKAIGRELLAATPGATFMLNPNDAGCVLYPEEIDALLRTGSVARVEKIQLEDDAPFLVFDEAAPPFWLMPSLMGLCAQMPFVQVAYLLKVAPLQAPADEMFLIVLGVSPEHAERAARATITEIQPICARHRVALDISVFDPAKGIPGYLRQQGVERIYGPPLN